jgi:hypothetical protein
MCGPPSGGEEAWSIHTYSSSLFAVIVRALRLFVRTEEANAMKIGTGAVHEGEFMRRCFWGCRPACQAVHTTDDRLVDQVVTRNARGKLTLYTTGISYWSTHDQEG